MLALEPGDVVLWDGHTPTDVEIVEPFHKRTLLFPRQRVLAVCPRLAELRALPPLDGSGPARLLVRYMNALALEQPWLEGAAGVAAANAALELLRRSGRAVRADQPGGHPRGDARGDPALRADPPAGPGPRPGLDRPRLRDVGARAARAVRGRRRVGGRTGALRAARLGARRTYSGSTAGRSPTSRSGGGSATRRTSRACSSARSGSPRATCASRRSAATSSRRSTTRTAD